MDNISADISENLSIWRSISFVFSLAFLLSVMSIFIAIAMDSSPGRAVRTAGKMWHKTCKTSPFFVVIFHSFLGEGLFWRMAFLRYFLNSFPSDTEVKKPLRVLPFTSFSVNPNNFSEKLFQ